LRGLENVGGLAVRTRVQQGHSFNKVRHKVDGSHVVSIHYEGPNEVTVSATAYIDPSPTPAATRVVDDLGDAPDEVQDAIEDDLGDGLGSVLDAVEHEGATPSAADVSVPPPRQFQTLIYKDLNSRSWDLGTIRMGTRSKRTPYEFVLHDSHKDCRGGREHIIRLSVSARALWPAGAEDETEVEFVVRCSPEK
jgi:hypothetical protein